VLPSLRYFVVVKKGVKLKRGNKYIIRQPKRTVIMHRPVVGHTSVLSSSSSQSPPLVVVVVARSFVSVKATVDSVLSGYRKMFAVTSSTDDGIVPMAVVACHYGGGDPLVEVVFSSSSTPSCPSRLPLQHGGSKRMRGDRDANVAADSAVAAPRHSSIASYGLLQHNGLHSLVAAAAPSTSCEDATEDLASDGVLRVAAAGLLRSVTLLRRIQRDTSLQHTAAQSNTGAGLSLEARPMSGTASLQPLASGGNVLVLLDEPLAAASSSSTQSDQLIRSNALLFSGDVAFSSATVNLVKMGASLYFGVDSRSTTSAADCAVVSRLTAATVTTGGEAWWSNFTSACFLTHLFYRGCPMPRSSAHGMAVPYKSSQSSTSIGDVSVMANRYIVPPLPLLVEPTSSTTQPRGGVSEGPQALLEECNESRLYTCPRCMLVVGKRESSDSRNSSGETGGTNSLLLVCPICS
jgi:hypothetical protein